VEGRLTRSIEMASGRFALIEIESRIHVGTVAAGTGEATGKSGCRNNARRRDQLAVWAEPVRARDFMTENGPEADWQV
jgi:hypothetical protein